jgi:hydroxyacylglutathione hydrolase
MAPLAIHPIPAWQDNYFWLIFRGDTAVVVDPGMAEPVLEALAARQLTLTAILLTHHHPDHVGGVDALARATGARVYGNRADSHRLPELDHHVTDGDCIALTALGVEFTAIATPGHTLGHLCYSGAGLLLAGDTLFSGGCGRRFEGSAEQYWASMLRLRALPPDTQVLCAHEYTLSNLRFAESVLPADEDIACALSRTQLLRAQGLPSVPSRLGDECRHNVFLRCDEPILSNRFELPASRAAEVFDALRRAKDQFHG